MLIIVELKVQGQKEELLKFSTVKAVGLTGQVPGAENLKTEPFGFETNEGNFSELLTNYMFAGPDVVPALGLSIAAGQNFNPEKAVDIFHQSDKKRHWVGKKS